MKIEFSKEIHRGKGKFEYDQIDENIYIGSNLCCVTHFKEELLEKGITVDISVEGEAIDQPKGIKVFCWLPTKDHTPPSGQQLQTGAELIDSVVRQNKKVYVHCQKIGRASCRERV